MYNPINIANYFLKRYGHDNDIRPMKLVKLVYISHGWYLGMTGNALLDENPEAWKYGPVLPSIYFHFREYGNRPIKKSDFIPDPFGVISEDIKLFLDKIWQEYGKFSYIQLSEKTHELGTPWYQIWNRVTNLNKFRAGFFVGTNQIPDNLIKKYYQDKFLINKGKAFQLQ